MIDKRAMPAAIAIRLRTQLIRRPNGAFYDQRCTRRGTRNFTAQTSSTARDGRPECRRFGRHRRGSEGYEERDHKMDRAAGDLHCCFSAAAIPRWGGGKPLIQIAEPPQNSSPIK